MVFDPVASAGSGAMETGCVACQNVPVTATVGMVPTFTVGVDAKAGSVPEMLNDVLVIEPMAFNPAGSAGEARKRRWSGPTIERSGSARFRY